MNFSFDFPTILSILLTIAVIGLGWLVYSLHEKLNKFLIGGTSESLPDSLSSIDSALTGLESFKKEIEAYLTTVEARLKKSVQAVHTVRFNPFQGTTGSGGNQSFATAFLNEYSDGVVVSSLYARDRVSIFAKPIINGASEYELSEEEAQAVKEARKLLK